MASPSKEWQKGFDDGRAWAHKYYSPEKGMALPDNYVHRGGGWHNGFGEGLITGRHEVFDAKYPGNCGFSMQDGKLVVHYPK